MEEEGPRAVFPACVGYPKYASGMVGGDKKNSLLVLMLKPKEVS